MLESLEEFTKRVEEGTCGCVVSILRVKNGFQSVAKWKSYQDCDYCDLKLNVLISNKSKTASIIGELQWLLRFQLQAKKLCVLPILYSFIYICFKSDINILTFVL